MYIDENGIIDHERVIVKIFPNIERGPMTVVNGIVVHQTTAPETSHTFNSYINKGANGAHFLIDKNGIIYQTASLYRVTNHVGFLKSRCKETLYCSPAALSSSQKAHKLGPKLRHRHEIKKSFPERYPYNADSIGIELVGETIQNENKKINDGEAIFVEVTEKQNESLKFLVQEIIKSLKLDVHKTEIYKHPTISQKNMTEARSAKWEK
jgi:N-acetyl-anhydromuramyl-L-alanine amidase AmpD